MSGATRERLLANLLLFDLLHAAKGRSNVGSDARKPFWVFLDEVQTYDGVASGTSPRCWSRAPSSGCGRWC